jgi:hypothetical protein
MAAKTKTLAKKTTGAKVATASKKTPTQRKISRGETLACEVCGTVVTVDQIGDAVIEQENILFCCDKPMREKATSKKGAAKK